MSDTLKQLQALPELAALIWLQINAPYRGEQLGIRTVPQSRPVADLAALDALGRLTDLVQAVRCVAETLRDSGQPWGELATPPTWISETRWLAQHRHVWDGDEADEYAASFVPDTIREVHAELFTVSREPRPIELWCLDCGGVLRIDAGALRCGDCAKLYHAKEVADMLDKATPRSLPEIAERLEVPLPTIYRWASVIPAVSTHKPTKGKPALYALGSFQSMAAMTRQADTPENHTVVICR